MIKYLKLSLMLLLILSIFIVGCNKQLMEEKIAGETIAAETPLSPEEEDIETAFTEIDDLESLDEDFDLDLKDLDDLELE